MSGTQGLVWALKGLAVLGLSAVATPQQIGDDSPGHAQTAVSEVSQSLRKALELKRQLWHLSDAERSSGRRAAIQALLAVAAAGGAPAAIRAEASFRAGEMLRADGSQRSASTCFERARELGADTPFRTRAMLELGHLDRRSGNWSSALDHYFELSHEMSARRTDRDAALYWSGTVELELDDFDAARRTWNLVARAAERPLDRIRAFDRLAALNLDRGDRAAALETLRTCDAALEPLAAELTGLGTSVGGALARMRSRRMLESARE